MIKTRIFQFVGHIHNMQLCIEMISFINHENESILRWFYSFVNPGILAFVLGAWSGCIQAGWGSDLWLSAVVLWNSAPHVSTMLGSNLDLSDLVLDILHAELLYFSFLLFLLFFTTWLYLRHISNSSWFNHKRRSERNISMTELWVCHRRIDTSRIRLVLW